MSTALAETVSIVLLVGVLLAAMVQPRRLPEALFAVPAALIIIATGVVSWSDAVNEMSRLGPTVGFLAAVLVLAALCEAEGVFRMAGALLARRSHGRPVRLLLLVFVVASAFTAALSLDATIVLLTPVVFATASQLRVQPKPHLYACTHLANTASLVLPVSNLTNLLAFAVAGVSFWRFAQLMALPWLVAIAIEFFIFRRAFRSDLQSTAPVSTEPHAETPIFALVVIGLALVGFGLASLIHLNAAWIAAMAAGILAVRRLVKRQTKIKDIVTAANPLFLIFVLALGVIVRGVEDNGLGNLMRTLLPNDSSIQSLFITVGLAAVLSNVVNNLPAVLMLLPTAVDGGIGLVMAVLLGVNIGPNLTYVGSLATLLWRRSLNERNVTTALGEFLRLGALTVPAALVGSTLALWVGLQLWGG